MKSLAFFSQFKIYGFVLLFTLALTNTGTAQNYRGPLIVELFTSKYCPACPGADRIFNQMLEDNPEIIGISCHVTYFNRSAARKDLLSKPFCDARQNVYKLALNTGGIFTPMMILNGQNFTTALKPDELQKTIEQSAKSTYQPVDVFLNGQYVDISLPSLPLKKSADVWLFEIEKTTDLKGHTHYKNSASKITKLLRWDGKALNMAFPVKAPSGKTYALLIQNYKGGIVAAGQTP